MPLITAEQLQNCTFTLSQQRCEEMAILINKLCDKYGITTKDVLHEFLANVIHESGEFTHKVENMYYRAQTLANTWPNRFSATSRRPYSPNGIATRLERKPEELSNVVYGGRMGNRPGTSDGWNFRGSGFIGLTGRSMFEKFAKYKGFDTPEEAANYCRDSDYGALDSAFWFFCIHKDLEDEADRDDIIGIVKQINGGLIGIEPRLKYYELIKKHVV